MNQYKYSRIPTSYTDSISSSDIEYTLTDTLEHTEGVAYVYNSTSRVFHEIKGHYNANKFVLIKNLNSSMKRCSICFNKKHII